MKDVKLIFVGGFLGAGKTTLLSQTARALAQAGKKVGIITNDQADDLVDTGLIRQEGFGVREVAGGCFCCRFDDLVNAAGNLLETLQPDVLLGEPVGSCTDISATVLQPLKDLYGDWFSVAPFSVLADPARLREVLAEQNPTTFPDSVLYIFAKQLEEADIIVVNKTDLLTAEEQADLVTAVRTRYPGTTVLTMSALGGKGVAEWLAALNEAGPAGRRVVEVDYDTYADGEAVLGWLNATVQLSAEEPTDWTDFADRLIRELWGRLRDRSSEIAHLKLLVQTATGSLVANATSTAREPTMRGALEGATNEAVLVLNARVHLPPEELRTLVEDCLRSTAGDRAQAEVAHIQSLSPGRPEPKHRYDRVV